MQRRSSSIQPGAEKWPGVRLGWARSPRRRPRASASRRRD